MDVDAVVFDLDETLFDHRSAAREGVIAWLSSMGADTEPSLVASWFEAEERFVGAWSRGELDWTGQRRARIRSLEAQLGARPGDDAAVDASFAVYLGGYESAWRAFPDAAATLALITRAGIRTAVLTNGADHQQRRKLAACALDGLVGDVFCADAIGFAKPDPRSYRHACAQLGVEPSRTVHVGDRHDLDVIGARQAGLTAIHLDRTGRGPADEPLRIASLAELPARLGIADGDHRR